MKTSMIMLLAILLLSAATMIGAGAYAASLEYWTFDTESAGKAFGANFVNSGSLDSEWNFGGPDTIATDGAGNLVIDTTHNGAVYRKLPKKGTANAHATQDQYAAPIITGVYRLEIDLNSWDLTANAVGADMTWAAANIASGGTTLAAIRLEKDSASTTRIRLFSDLTGTSAGYRDYAYNLIEAGGATVAIEFDFDNDTVDYYVDGDLKQSFTDFEATQLGSLVFNTDGAWLAGSTVLINEMGLGTPPEPPALQIQVTSLPGSLEVGETNDVSVIISNTGGTAAPNVTTELGPAEALGAFSVTSNTTEQTLGPADSMTNTYTLVSNTNGTFLFTVQTLIDGTLDSSTNFTVAVGSQISYQGNSIAEVSGGLIPGKYEPGETLEIEVYSENIGAKDVSNVVNSLSADPAYFSISNLTSSAYPFMPVGASTSTVYRVEILPAATNGTYGFSVINQAGARMWMGSFPLDVLNQAQPGISPPAVNLTVTEGLVATASVTVTNVGNMPLTFSVTDDAVWDHVLSVDTAAMPSTQLSGGTALPLIGPSPAQAYYAGESDTIDIGFDFPFYETTWSKLYIDSNGAIIFSTSDLVGNTAWADDSTGDLPRGNRPLIAPFRHVKLQISDASPVRTVLKSNPTRLVIIHDNVTLATGYTGVPHGTNIQFQTELFADGRIKFSYYNINGSELHQVAVGIQDGAGSFMNVDMIPASGTAVLINRTEPRWVSYSPAGGEVLPLGSTVVTFTADATSQAIGSANAFTTIFGWSSGGSDDVVVDASVVAAVPVLETPAAVVFEGNAGEITTTMLALTNSGSAPLNFSITDDTALSATYEGAVASGAVWTEFSGDTLAMIDPDPNPYINADNEGYSTLQPIGFEFPFYGGVYTHFSAGVNGGISLGTLSRMWAIDDFAATGDNVPQQFIAPYWGNLLLDGNASISFQNLADQLVVTWENMEQSGVTPGIDLTFQAVLHDDGRIEFRYQQVNGSFWPLTPWGIRSGTARSTSGLLILPGDEIITLDEYGYPKTNYVNVISDRVVSMTSSNYPLITYTPSQGNIPAGGTAEVELRGNAGGMTPGGANSVTNMTTLNIAYEAGVNDVDVTFMVNNSVEDVPVSPLAAADADGDGMKYDDELIAGTDPLDAKSVFTVSTDAGRVISWPTAEGRTYTVWYALSLKDDFVPLPGAVGISAGTFTDTLHTDAPVIFYKVSVD